MVLGAPAMRSLFFLFVFLHGGFFNKVVALLRGFNKNITKQNTQPKSQQNLKQTQNNQNKTQKQIN